MSEIIELLESRDLEYVLAKYIELSALAIKYINKSRTLEQDIADLKEVIRHLKEHSPKEYRENGI